tara:strand:- start:11780 stop:12067 length:288 start_codon:yes stop_codon:yes gene_type:complete
MNANWFVYVVKCSDESLYCGITTDISRRVHEHNFSKRAAKYTRSRRPVSLVFLSCPLSRSRAASIEAKFKKLPAKKKRVLISNDESFNTHFHIDE